MRLPRFLAVMLVLGVVVPLVRAEDKPKTIGSVDRKDPRFDKLIPKDAVIEQLADGFAWTEGPVWVPKDGGYLLFSDIPNNRVVKWQEGKGTSDFLKPSGYTGDRKDLVEPGSNGLLLDPMGNLILMQHGNRQVARLGKDGKSFETVADKYNGTQLNSPNDGTYAANGDLYFTDPPYGLMVKDKEGQFPGQNLDFQGIYRLPKDGKLTLLTKEMTRPNGIALSPDDKTLYVANSDPKEAVWKKFEVKSDGTLSPGKLLFDVTDLVKAGKPGLPDGMKVDKDGNIFATGPAGVFVFAPDGTHIGTIVTNCKTGNCCFGNDGSTLYVMCDKAIGRIKTTTKGRGF
jgi:gluconolactonase